MGDTMTTTSQQTLNQNLMLLQVSRPLDTVCANKCLLINIDGLLDSIK